MFRLWLRNVNGEFYLSDDNEASSTVRILKNVKQKIK